MILALDLGTKTGWATSHPTGSSSGVWDLKISKFDSSVMRLIKFREQIMMTCLSFGVSMIVFEEVRYHRAIDAAHLYSAFLTVLQLHCHDDGLRYKGIPVGTIKKHATGNGSAKKDAMIRAANKFYPSINVLDDNHADALCLSHLATEKF